MFKNIELYWFSGTGNTLIAAETFAEEMQKNNITVNLNSLPSQAPETIEADCLAVFFPVYAQTCPPFIYDWIKTLPDSQTDQPVIVLDTMAKASGLVKAPLKQLFESKGYKPLAILEQVMPSNYFFTMSDKRNAKIIEDGKNSIREFARNILNGNTEWPETHSHPIAYKGDLSLFNKFCAFAGKRLHANKNCTKCGLCVKLCPVNNISMTDKGPEWSDRCQQCVRCINFCPEQAIKSCLQLFLYQLAKYTAPGVSAKDLLEK